MTLETLITSLESTQIHHLLAARNKPEVFSVSWSLSWWQPLRYVWPNITAPLAVSGGEQGDLMSAHLLESLELKETQHTGFPACYNSQLDFCTCLFLSGRITNYSQPPGQEGVLEMYKKYHLLPPKSQLSWAFYMIFKNIQLWLKYGPHLHFRHFKCR